MDAQQPAFDSADAMRRFRDILDSKGIDARQAFAPNTVYRPSVVVWLLVFQRLNGNASLEKAVTELHRLTDLLPDNRRITEDTLSANTGSYSQARARLDAQVAEDVADHVFGTLMGTTPPSWQNRRVFIVDGTTSKLTPTKKLQLLYPPASNQHGPGVWPIMHWAVAHELSSGCALLPETGAMYGPNAVSETELAKRMFGRIPKNSVLMNDRNFGIFGYFYAAIEAGHDVVSRLTEARFRSMLRKAKQVGPGTWKLTWQPTPWERKKHPDLPDDASVSVMLHERKIVLPDGKELTLWLATTLNADGVTLAALYRERINVETDIRDVKIALKMEELSGKSPDILRKELAMGIVAYNLVVQVRRLAAARINLKPRRLSFTGVWTLVQILLLSPNEWTLEKWTERFKQVLRLAGQRKLPNRPGRSYKRETLPRGRKFPNRPRIPIDQTPK